MKFEKRRLIISISAIWVLASIPMSEAIFNAFDYYGGLMRLFFLIILASPVWFYFGVIWVVPGIKISRFYEAVLLLLGGAAFIYCINDRSLAGISYIPIAASAVFVIIAEIERRSFAVISPLKGKSNNFVNASDLHKENIRSASVKAKPMLATTEFIANEIMKYINDFGGASPMPGILRPESSSTISAYTLMYASYRSMLSPPIHNSKPGMVLMTYQALMVQNISFLSLPRVPGHPQPEISDLDDENIRMAGRSLVRIADKSGEEIIKNIKAGVKNKFLPAYEGLRPYFSEKITDEELADMFEDKFADLYTFARKCSSGVVLQA